MDEREIFEGSENTLTMTQTYTHEFQCQYGLRNYPFDKQVPENYILICVKLISDLLDQYGGWKA